MASDSRSSNDDSLSSPTHISNPSSEAGSHQKRHRYQAKAALTVWKDLLHRRSSSKIPSLRDTITHPHLDCTENMKFSREYEPHSAKPKRESGDESQSVSSQDPLADFDPAKLLPDLELSPILPSQYSHAGLNAVSSAKTRGEKPLDGETAYGEGREDPQRSYPLSPNREGSTKDESTSIVEDWMQSIQFMPNLASSSTSDLTTFYNERLSREQHDILERHFQQQSKPSTTVKKGIADSMGVSLDRINNWFQNRRAKVKQQEMITPYGMTSHAVPCPNLHLEHDLDEFTRNRSSVSTTVTGTGSRDTIFSRHSIASQHTVATALSETISDSARLRQKPQDPRNSQRFSRVSASTRSSVMSHPPMPLLQRQSMRQEHGVFQQNATEGVDQFSSNYSTLDNSETTTGGVLGSRPVFSRFSSREEVDLGDRLPKVTERKILSMSDQTPSIPSIEQREAPQTLSGLQKNTQEFPATARTQGHAELKKQEDTVGSTGVSTAPISNLVVDSTETGALPLAYPLSQPLFTPHGDLTLQQGEAPPNLSPLEAFAMEGRLLAKRLKEEKNRALQRQNLPLEKLRMIDHSEELQMTSIPLELDIAIDPDESLDPEASDSDDLSSNFTDYTEVSLLEATDAADFGPSLTQILVDLKSDLVDQVMGVVHNIILSKDGYIYHQSGNDGSQGTQGSTSGTPNQSSSNQARKGPGKRPLSQKDDRSANGGNDGDPSKRKKLDSDAQLHSNILRKFACPFYQHNPQKNSSRRSCRGPGWPSVHRVKEHLYRHHARPLRCYRCLQAFKEEAKLQQHLRAEKQCENKTELIDYEDDFDKDQEKKLRGRKRPPGQTEEQRWIETYRILFAHVAEVDIPSPYYEVDVHNTPLDPTVLSRVERFLDAEIAPRVANGIEARILALRMALDDEIREALPSIIRQSIQDSFQDIQHQILNILNTVPPVGSLGSQNPSHDNNNFFQQRQNDLPTFMPHYEKTQYNHSTRLPPAGTGMSFGATNENSFATDQNIGIALSLGLPAPFTLSEAHESATCTNAIQEEQSAGYNQDWTKKINWTAQDQYSIDMVSEPFHNNQEPNHELDHDGNTHESKDAPLHPTFDPGIIVHDLNYFSQPFSIPEFTVHPDGLPSGTLAAKPKVLASFGSAQDEMRSIGSPATIN